VGELPEWGSTPAGVLLIVGLLILIGAGSFVLGRHLRRKWSDDDDEFPTQIDAGAGKADAAAFLIAMDASLRLPQRIALYEGRETRLGRDRRSNTVTLNDISISRRHARIIGEGRGFILQDEGSRGGTYVNRRRLHTGERHLLQHSETIQFYTFTYQFILTEAPTQVIDGEETIPSRLETDQSQ